MSFTTQLYQYLSSYNELITKQKEYIQQLQSETFEFHENENTNRKREKQTVPFLSKCNASRCHY